MTHLLDPLLNAWTALAPASIAGALGVAANGVWPLLRGRRRILSMQMLGTSLFGLHYLLLGANTGAATCVAGVLQGLAATTLENRMARNAVFGVTLAGCAALAAANWSGLPSALALAGLLAATAGRLQRREQSIRLFFLGSEAFWISHNTLVGSSWGLASDTMAVTMLLAGLWRGRAAACRA